MLGSVLGVANLSLSSAQLSVGERVGLTIEGRRIPLSIRPCSTLGHPAPYIGTDGLLVASTNACYQTVWWRIHWADGAQGWMPEILAGRTHFLPMPGEGTYPNVQATGAYPIRVAPEGNPLNVRSGPGLSFGVIAQKPAGSTGWAYSVSVDTANRLVWWKIRWDDGNGGQVGWSADSRLMSGVYLQKTGAKRAIHTVQVETSLSGVSLSVSPRDLQGNPASGSGTGTLSLSYVAGTSLTLTAPATAPDGTPFARWELNGASYSTNPTITLPVQNNLQLRAVYQAQTEAQFLQSLVAPWRSGQLWTPSTYDGHTSLGVLYAVDFNRASNSRTSCPYTSGWIQDCDEVMLASHAGRVYNRAQSGCTGYGNYVVLVSPVRVGSSGNTYLATIYGHLNWFLASNGTDVSAGQPIGRLGSTGNSTGPHLHYEIREVTVSGSTLSLGNRRQVLNNPAIRLSGQPLEVDLNCRVSGLGYAGPPLQGTVTVGTIPSNIAGSCAPFNCGNFLWEGSPTEIDHCLGPMELPGVLYLTNVNGDDGVDEADLMEVLWALGTNTPACDIDGNGVVDETDLLMVLMDLGQREE